MEEFVMSNALLSTAKSVRQMVIQQIQSISEELFDVQPDQFNNTIRWNVKGFSTMVGQQ